MKILSQQVSLSRSGTGSSAVKHARGLAALLSGETRSLAGRLG